MMFCPKCGSLMGPKEEKGKKVLGCACGYVAKKLEQSNVKEVIAQDTKPTEIMSDEPTSLPLTDEQCPKCKHPRAYWWSKQTRASDEPETRFMRCESCKHTWRDAS